MFRPYLLLVALVAELAKLYRYNLALSLQREGYRLWVRGQTVLALIIDVII